MNADDATMDASDVRKSTDCAAASSAGRMLSRRMSLFVKDVASKDTLIFRPTDDRAPPPAGTSSDQLCTFALMQLVPAYSTRCTCSLLLAAPSTA